MKTIKFGIFGLRRGGQYVKSILANNGEIVAVCDMNPARLSAAKEKLGNDVALYTDFDEFINHKGLDAVFLCNFFHEHAAFAIKALNKNIHVLSECLSNATMAEGVALVRAAEKSKAIYMLSENYPYMIHNQEMRKIYAGGSLGKVLYAEGEYNHPVDPADAKTIWDLRPHPRHWRNYLPRTYYITHSLAPLMYITGSTPVRVTAMPVFSPHSKDGLAGLMVGDSAAIITCLNDDNSVFRVTGCSGFGAHENSCRICGEKGQVENIRGSEQILLRYNSWDVPEGTEENTQYTPQWDSKDRALIEMAGHGGGDFFVIREFFRCIRENRQPDFDVYSATTMASVAILSHRSAMESGVPYDIPDFHRESDRVKFETDTRTPFWGSEGTPPTDPACSHADYAPTEDEWIRYSEIIKTQ